MSNSLSRRLAIAERLARNLGSSADCICFPANEPPFFSSKLDEDRAHSVKCPLHGDRFRKLILLYRAPWREERDRIRRQNTSAQFRKAWLASGLGL
jgi:hypothetical protein